MTESDLGDMNDAFGGGGLLPDGSNPLPEHFELSPAGQSLRSAVMERTLAVMRGRRRRRRLASLVLAAALFGGGVASGVLITNDRAAPREEPVRTTPPVRVTPYEDDPELTEILAETAPQERQAALFEEAGDRFASSGPGGFVDAIRCYEQSLDGAAGADGRSPVEGHWLMLALAQSRRLEGDGR